MLNRYFYQVGHKLYDGSYDWGRESFFKAPPYPGQDSLQRVIIFGDMGKVIVIIILSISVSVLCLCKQSSDRWTDDR